MKSIKSDMPFIICIKNDTCEVEEDGFVLHFLRFVQESKKGEEKKQVLIIGGRYYSSRKWVEIVASWGSRCGTTRRGVPGVDLRCPGMYASSVPLRRVRGEDAAPAVAAVSRVYM